jgi:hypothetical protein
MFGLMATLGPSWDSLWPWVSPAHVLGVVILGLFLVLHVTLVRSVIRPLDSPVRVMTTHDKRVREPAYVQPQVRRPDAKASESASRKPGRVRAEHSTPRFRQLA